MNFITSLVRLLCLAALLTSVAGSSARAEEAPAAAPAAPTDTASFVGHWKVQDGKGRDYFITLAADGTAASKWSAAEEQRRNQSGSWVATEGGVLITWNNGWRDAVVTQESGFLKKAYAPKMKVGEEPANTSPALKVEALPAG